MPQYTANGFTWNYIDNGDGTATIGTNAGSGNATTSGTGISGSVTIPDVVGGLLVTSIGVSAFHNCGLLQSITIPNAVKLIKVNSFRSTGLTSIILPESLITIESTAFRESKITSLTIPNSVTTIATAAFFRCTSLTTVTIGNSMTYLSDYMFGSCWSLTSLTIPSSVTSIDANFVNDTNSELIVVMDTKTISGTTYTSPTTTDISFFGNPSVTLIPLTDTIPPTMTITSTTVANNATTNNSSISLTFTSSEVTTNFTQTDISLVNGTLSNFAGSGQVYTATFTPSSQGACTISVPANRFTDEAENNNTGNLI